MTAWIAPLVAAAAVVAAPTLAWWLNARRTAKAAEQDRQRQAYVDLLVASFGVAQRAATLLTATQLRSGLGEALDVAFRLRKPVDPLELHDWINVDLSSLADAWSRTWVYGSPQGVARANRLMDACADVIGVLHLVGATGWRQKTRQFVVGIDTKGIAAERAKRLKVLAEARRDLAEFMRTESGSPTAELFSPTPPVPAVRNRQGA